MTWLCTEASQTFSGTFSGTLLNPTWLCTKASQNLLFSKTFSGTLLNPTGLCTKPSHTFSGTFSGTLLILTLQSLPDLLLRNPAAPKPPGTSSGTFFGTLLNLTWLCTKASQTFSGTFSAALLNLSWLCTKASQTFSGTFGTFSALNLTRHLHQCTPELFWAEDPISLRCWGKTQCFATFLPFRAPASSFFWLFLFSDRLSSSLLFSDSSYLCFSICPYCRKFDF